MRVIGTGYAAPTILAPAPAHMKLSCANDWLADSRLSSSCGDCPDRQRFCTALDGDLCPSEQSADGAVHEGVLPRSASPPGVWRQALDAITARAFEEYKATKVASG